MLLLLLSALALRLDDFVDGELVLWKWLFLLVTFLGLFLLEALPEFGA